MKREKCDVCAKWEARCYLTRPASETLPTIRYFYCGYCRSQYVAPRDGLLEDAGELYDVEYGESGPGKLGLELDFRDEAVLKTYRHAYNGQLELVERLIGKPGNLLDIGCGAGWFLYSAKSRGWKVSGVDVSPKFTTYVKRTLKIEDVFTGQLQDVHFPAESFDVVTMKEVIEHVPDPHSLMAQVGRLIKPGGWLVVETPNPNSIHAHAARLLCRLTGSPVFAAGTDLYPPIHLWGFSGRSLPFVFSWARVELDRWWTVGYGDNPWLFLDPCIYPHFYGNGVRGLIRRVGFGLDSLFAGWAFGVATIAFGQKK